MPALLHPGVYVQEVPSKVRAIEGAQTSTTIFVGETERGPIGPTKIKSRTEYERFFGGYVRALDTTGSPSGDAARRILMKHHLDGFFQNGGTTAYILRAMDGWDTAASANRQGTDAGGDPVDILEASSPGIWGNNVYVALLASSDADPDRFRIAVVYDSPEDGEKSLVEDWDRLSADPDDESYAPDVLKRSAFIQWIEDADVFRPDPDPSFGADPEDSDIILGAPALTGGLGGGGDLLSSDYAELMDEKLAGIDDAALIVAGCEAFLTTDDDAEYCGFTQVFIDYVNVRPRLDLFFVGDLPAQHGASTPTTATQSTLDTLRSDITANNFSSLYWPWVVVSDPIGVGKNPKVKLPPAGYVAGLFARTDARRGVWKAPAGTEATLGGTLSIEHQLHDGHSDELNPKGVNALRVIPGAGRVVWGARTLVPSSEWRYVPVRRTAIYLRTSIYNGIQWAVFEPNDEPLWSALRTSIGAFMEIQFRNGAFAGSTSKEAYFVKVDSETTTEDDQAAGIVNILVGFCPLRPAEFVVVKLSQKTQSEG